MSEEPEAPKPPSVPQASCPTCHRLHSVALEDGHTALVLCECGKLLRIERSHNALVVIEQIQALTAATPPE